MIICMNAELKYGFTSKNLEKLFQNWLKNQLERIVSHKFISYEFVSHNVLQSSKTYALISTHINITWREGQCKHLFVHPETLKLQ